MTKKQLQRFRPSALEALEDRAVPSTLGLTARVTSTGSTVAAQLAQVTAQINSAYSTFAVAVRQAEATLIATAATGAPSGTPGSVSATIAQQVATLQAGVTSAVQGHASATDVALIQAQLTGATPGSLASQLSSLLPAALANSTAGAVPQASLPLLFTAVDGIISTSFHSTSIDVNIYASGNTTGKLVQNFNLASISSQFNAAYSTFATNVNQAEFTLVGSTVSAATTHVAVTTINQQVAGLYQTLASLVGTTSVASRAAAIQGQFIGADPASLQYRLDALLAVSASADGTIPQSSLPLLFTAINAEIGGSYTSTAIDAYLLAST